MTGTFKFVAVFRIRTEVDGVIDVVDDVIDAVVVVIAVVVCGHSYFSQGQPFGQFD